MNNSKLVIDSISLKEEEPKFDRAPELRQRETQLINIIDSLKKVQAMPEWSSLKTQVFDGLVTTLEKELRNEAKKDSPDSLKLNRLAGQLKWAEKFSDLSKLEQVFRVELQNLRKMLYGKE